LETDKLTKDEKKLLLTALNRYAYEMECIGGLYHDEANKTRLLIRKLGLIKQQQEQEKLDLSEETMRDWKGNKEHHDQDSLPDMLPKD